MANPQRGEIDIVVNGRTLTLAMDLNAMCELQAALRPSDPESVELDDVMQKVSRMNPIYLRAFLWATLRRHHRDITLAAVSDLVVDAGGIQAFFDKIPQLLSYTQPDARDQGAVQEAAANGHPPQAAAAAAGIGRRSTGKRAKSA
jgi:hypothetical protein